MISYYVKQLVDYAEKSGLIEKADRTYAINSLIGILGVDEYTDCDAPEAPLEDILRALDDYAVEKGITENSVVYRDLFDAKLMGALTPRPSEVIRTFNEKYAVSPETATDWYYNFSRATDYIRTYRVKKDLKWKTASQYGDIDITINLSKPEKDPKAIAAAKNAPQSGYPKCLLCTETEGYYGRVNFPARENHRIIPITIGGQQWRLQYSPYVYYNEHCIALSAEHKPMNVNAETVVRMFDFVTIFPHYFIGSNAGLPIVGGSILSHEHMQGGRYTFAMERAPLEREFIFKGFENVRAGRVKWPMSVIRMTSPDRKAIERLAVKLFDCWNGYTDESVFVFANTDGAPHNAITPIARRRGDDYELDLVLRNNITTPEYPDGYFHPHPDKHNIKKENIGLIEVMGLAVLPSRLKNEMAQLKTALIEGRDISADETLAKHSAWADAFRKNYTFTEENTDAILRGEIGKTFVKVLEDAGVFKYDAEGTAAFDRFINSVGVI